MRGSSGAVYLARPAKGAETERALVIGGDAGSRFRVTWAFVLEPLDESHTRLLTRAGADYERRPVGIALNLVARPMHFAMQRRQLLNLKRRVTPRVRGVVFDAF